MTTGMFCDASDIIINGIPLNTIDENHCVWLVTDLDGWWGLPDPEIPNDPRPYSEDGDYYSSGRYSSRNITLTGQIIPRKNSNSNSIVVARTALNRALNLVRQTGILQVNEYPPKQASVQIVGRPITKIDNISNRLDFNVQLRSSDPRKYSLQEEILTGTLPSTTDNGGGRTYPKTFNYAYGELSSTGLMSIDNEGSYDSFGILRITGPVTNPSIEHIESGAVLSFDITLNVGEYLDIDLRSKSIILNDFASRRTTLKPSSRWFNILPGKNTIRFNGVQHIPDVTEPMIYLSYRSAWIE